ncbi:MAG: DEAD/DEAH box helicase, partial [Gemmatimonadota bacterium]
LEDALSALTDAVVRRSLGEDGVLPPRQGGRRSPAEAWLQALTGADARVRGPAPRVRELRRSIDAWTAAARSSPVRTCFRLHPPAATDGGAHPEADAGVVEPDHEASDAGPAGDADSADRAGAAPAADRWRIEFLLQARDDPTLLVPAERVWEARGPALTVLRRRVESPQETLLGDLGRAMRLFPDLERALRSPRPAGLDLDAAGAHRFLRECAPLLEQAGFGVIVPSWWKKPAARLGVRLRASTPGASDGEGTGLLGLAGVCAYEWRVAVGDEVLSHEEFRELARLKVPLVRVRGEWVELRPEEVDRAVALLDRDGATGEMTAAEALRVGLGVDPSPAGLPVTGFDVDGWLGELFGAGSGPGPAPGSGAAADDGGGGDGHGGGPDPADHRPAAAPQPRTFQGTLRPYQERGLAWLAFLDRFGLGACLADDMGLGKTIQLLALLLAEREGAGDDTEVDRENGDRASEREPHDTGDGAGDGAGNSAADGPGGGVTDSAASSTAEPANVDPGPTLLVCPMSVVGNWEREARRFAPSLRVHVHHGGERAAGEAFREAAMSSDFVITTYALAARDADDLAAVDWWRVALDEAQNIKNPATKRTRAIRRLPARRRVALTGTPVENRLSELWSIMEFLNPGLLGSATGFRKRFARPIERYRDEERAALLRRLTGPFVLRRLKTDRSIIRDLPEKVEMKVYCNLTREQATLYQAVVDEMLERVESSEGIDRKGQILSTMLKLKQVCNHPAQLLKDGSALDGRSGKVARLEEVLEEVVENGDRALVFTQFVEMGTLLRSHLRRRLGRDVLFLHGGTDKAARDAMVDRFQDGDADAPVFLLSLKAGGTGLNLTAANHVIHFDRWWNPAVEDQATDRAFRIGQRRDVQVRKFVCAGTLEERIDAMIESKKELADRIVGSGEGWLTEMSTAELRDVVALAADAVAE